MRWNATDCFASGVGRRVRPAGVLVRGVVPARKAEAGVIHVGWYEQNEVARRFVGDMYQLGFVHSFDRMTRLGTPEGDRFRRGPEAVATAGAEDLARLLTAIIRGGRFSDGELAGAHESGILLAIARRAGERAGG